MRVLKPVLGVSVVLTTLCFALAWIAAPDARVTPSREQAEPPRVVEARAPELPPAWAEWKQPEPALVPAPKPNSNRRFKRAAAKVSLVVPPLAPAVVPGAQTVLIRPEDAIRGGLRLKRAAFSYCYERELVKQSSFDGFVVVSVSLSVSGRVTNAHVTEGKQRDAQVGACIAAQLRKLQLPPLTEEADLLIPIRLHANKPT